MIRLDKCGDKWTRKKKINIMKSLKRTLNIIRRIYKIGGNSIMFLKKTHSKEENQGDTLLNQMKKITNQPEERGKVSEK